MLVIIQWVIEHLEFWAGIFRFGPAAWALNFTIEFLKNFFQHI